MQSAIRLLFLIALLTFGIVLQLVAADLQVFSRVKLVDNPANDGDSFFVQANGKSFHVRLYFVDCPETSAGSNSDAQRLREQTRYFGLSDEEAAIEFGNKAKRFVERVLSKPFTVYTVFANALGRSSMRRVYAFVTTADGNDLGSLLVKNGFARTHGVGRETPSRITRTEMFRRLEDMETSAILKRTGIWSKSNPDRILEMRARQRSEDQELRDIQNKHEKQKTLETVLDLNSAGSEELQFIKGIGPVLAERIIAGRPYKTVDDLLKVKGIGPKTLNQIRRYVRVGSSFKAD